MMADLDDSIRDDLARLRAQAGPSEAAKQRMWTQLAGRLGPEPDPDDGGSDGPGDVGSIGAGSGAGQIGFAAKVVAATLALTGAGLLTLRAGVVAVRSLAPRDPIEVREAPLDAERGSSSAPALQQPSPAGPLPFEAGEAADPSEKPARTAPARQAPAPARASTDAVDRSLTAELALLQLAHDASSPEVALTALDDHRRSFPEGQLADERELLRIEVLCGLGRLDGARLAAEVLLQRHDTMAARVHKVCPALEHDR